MALQPGDASGGELSTISDTERLTGRTTSVAGSGAMIACKDEPGSSVNKVGMGAREASQQVVVVGSFDCCRVACDFGQHPCWSAADRGNVQASRGVAVASNVVNKSPNPTIRLARSIFDNCLIALTA